MMCVHDGAGSSKTMAATNYLRELEPDEDIHRITFHARTIHHELHNALELPEQPPRYTSEFDQLLKHALATHPRTPVLDEAQWLQNNQP